MMDDDWSRSHCDFSNADLRLRSEMCVTWSGGARIRERRHGMFVRRGRQDSQVSSVGDTVKTVAPGRFRIKTATPN